MNDDSLDGELLMEPLEEFEDIEELGDDEDSPKGTESSPDTESEKHLIDAFKGNPLPVLIMNDQLRILYVNESCENLFHRFYNLQEERFTDVFGKALGVESLRGLLKALGSIETRYSWKGLIRSKGRETGTILTKASIFPLHSGRDQPMFSTGDISDSEKEFKNKSLNYVALFDDITEENRSLLRSVFLSLLEASKLKDNDTGKHINRVNLYSELLAENLFDKVGYDEIDRDFIDDIAFLAAMHDVGKIGTPDDILNKAGPLADWEWSIMKEHTKNGAYILSTYPHPMAREIALYHHERWDGKGYPYNLEKSMIPLAARIVTIADVYDALRMKRSYKDPYDHPTAIKMLYDWKESHFDPELIQVVEKIEDRFNRIYAENSD